jgi:predicted permease
MTDWIALYLRLATVLTPVMVCVGAGAFWGLRGNEFPGQFIGRFTTGVTVPALVFHTLSTTTLDSAILMQVGLAGVVGLLVCGVVGAGVLRLAGMPVAPLVPSVVFPNAGNLGLPMAHLAFGDNGLAVAIAIFTVCSLMQHTGTQWWFNRVSGHHATGGRRGGSQGVILACLVALGLRYAAVDIPVPILDSAKLLGSLAVPLMLISLGYALVTVTRNNLGQGCVIGFTRLGVGLVVGLLVMWVFNLPAEVAAVIQLQFMMPVAVVSYLYSDHYSRFGPVVAGAVVVSTLVFLLVAPVLLWWAERLG